MGVTVAANGLSVVHQGSGGEANATLPDVCLTKVGKPIVPIPYGNNAKSADLAKGTTTITMDGGNPVAIKGSTFSKSTGDAGGDKKGVASGTIEAEAEFISASPTVKFEGKGVCRLSDQMTMNKANTMCLGGAQNPSVSVTAEEEGTYTVDVSCFYPDGSAFKNAAFDIVDPNNSVLGSGTLSTNGTGSASGIPAGQIRIIYQESADDFIVQSPRSVNPHYREKLTDDVFFDLAAQGKQTFWQPARMQTVVETWGTMRKTLSSDPYFYNIVELETKSHFNHQHSNYSFSTLAEYILANVDSKDDSCIPKLIAQTLPLILDEGEILSTLLLLPKHETTNHFLAYMRARGKGNPHTYLQNYEWSKAKQLLNNELEALLTEIKLRIQSLGSEADRLNYSYLSKDIYSSHVDTINSFTKTLTDKLATAFADLEKKVSSLLNNGTPVSVILSDKSLYSAEAQIISNVVNTNPNIDLEEQQWIKVRAVHDDRWQTPFLAENIKITTNSVVHAEKAALNKSSFSSTISDTKELAIETQLNEGGVIAFDNLKPNTDLVIAEFKGEAGIEKEIENSRKSIEAYLDGIYNTLVQDMSGFQKQWEDEGLFSLDDGVISGAKGWGSDLVELFSPRIWQDIGDTLSSSSSDAYDYLYNYANDTYDSVTKSITDEEGNLRNVTWFIAQLQEDLGDIQQATFETIDDAIESAQTLYADGEDFLRKLECIAKNRQAILDLPKNLSDGDIDAIEIFVDTILMEIDPEWAKEIKESEHFSKALAVIQNHSSAMLYNAYLSLIIEAIPPNFYAYHAGKAGAYIALELIFTIALSVLTLGAGAATRIATVTAKLTLGTKRISTLNHASKALTTFIDTTKGMVDVLQDYDKLADKLIKRPMGSIKGKGNETLTMTKTNVKRNGKCRLCHSDEHKTPKLYRGEVNYI
ncbi:DUF4150 domain-containing protein [Aliivibrio fischeri]|uniref:DUF4150 domain-containing protein n=1 Tax=Aliivibrio fischeri TaxID=668 RepID=UPI003F76BC30